MDLPSSYTTCGVFFLGVGKGVFVGPRSRCVSGGCMVWNSIIVIHALVLAMSRMGFLILS